MYDQSVPGKGAVAVRGAASDSDWRGVRPGAFSGDLKRTARLTGAWYLVLAIAGMVGFLLVRPQVYVAGDPAATVANLVGREGVARLGLVLELSVVVAQALAAVWFYKLFQTINHTAAFGVAAFGMVNAIAIMASAVFLATALSVVGDASLAPGGDMAATVQLMYQLSTNFWVVGSLFFGLWLIPMGHIAASSGRMPTWLGRLLIMGGVGYLLSAFVGYGIPDAPSWLVELLPLAATMGEIWIIGYLLIIGVREPARHELIKPV